MPDVDRIAPLGDGTADRIPIARPYFGDEEVQAAAGPIHDGWVVQGPRVEAFERAFGEFTGSSHNIAASSCTTALHLAVAALGLKPGDEVIVPAFTWVATANVVEYMGATPRFCDIQLTTFNSTAEQIEAAITPRTVGIMPVHLFGLAADMPAVMAVAKKHSLWVVEDAACGFGASIHGQHVGTFGDAGCFSFHPRKSITTGEGGMVTTESAAIDRLTRSMRDHGANRTDLERHTGAAGYLLPEYDVLGFNYRLTDIQAAIGLVQMGRAAWILDRRRELAASYDERLRHLQWLRTPDVPVGYVHGYQSYVTLFAPEEPSLTTAETMRRRRNELMEALDRHGIATRQGTHAAALQSYYRSKYGIRPEDFPNAHLAEALSLALPLYPQMTEAQLARVVRGIESWSESMGPR